MEELRRSTALSFFLHGSALVAILAFGYLQPYEPPKIEFKKVEVIDSASFDALLAKGDKGKTALPGEAQAKMAEAPATRPELTPAMAEEAKPAPVEPVEDVAPEPAPAPKEIAPDPVPEPEPAAEPEPVKSEPVPEPEPAPAPEPVKAEKPAPPEPAPSPPPVAAMPPSDTPGIADPNSKGLERAKEATNQDSPTPRAAAELREIAESSDRLGDPKREEVEDRALEPSDIPALTKEEPKTETNATNAIRPEASEDAPLSAAPRATRSIAEVQAEEAEARRLQILEEARIAREEAEREAARQKEAARLEAERLEAERKAAEAEAARIEAERKEAERKEAERLEAERLAAERKAAAEAEEKRKAEEAAAEAEALIAKAEAERLASEKAAKEAAQKAAALKAQENAEVAALLGTITSGDGSARDGNAGNGGGFEDGHSEGRALSRLELGAITQKITSNWNKSTLIDKDDYTRLVIVVGFRTDASGELAGAINLVTPSAPDADFRIAFEAAKRAIIASMPLEMPDDIDPEGISWKLRFDPASGHAGLF